MTTKSSAIICIATAFIVYEITSMNEKVAGSQIEPIEGISSLEDLSPLPSQKGEFTYNPEKDGDPDKALDKFMELLPPGFTFDDGPAFRKTLQGLHQSYIGKPLPVPTRKQLKAIDLKLNMAELKRHNEYRKKHRAPPLQYDERIAVFSQAYAEILAVQMESNGGILKHNPNAKNYALGECLATDGPTNGICDSNNICDWGESTWKPKYDGHSTDMWYSEIEDYRRNGNKPISRTLIKGPQTGHFTQVVWKGTSKLGCGMACYATGSDPSIAPNKSCVVVCNYYIGGNVKGEYQKNVFVPRY